MKNDLLYPPTGTFRIIFLYVGQGESTLLIIPDENGHKYILVDSNIDEKNKESVNIEEFVKELGEDKIIFINTHPHDDHVRGVKEIKKSIREVWHSGHKPGKKYEDSFKDLESVIQKVGENNVFYLRGSNDSNILHTDREETSKTTRKIGQVDFRVFSPAKYVCDDIDDEDSEARRKRIHEQCGVIKFSYKGKSILLTGDSDKAAWRDYITKYHTDNLKSDVLSASHHGSRSFFKETEEDDDVYEKHMEEIAPEYLIISAPKQAESKHDHPHDDAVALYEKYIDAGNIFHLGKKNECVVADIDNSGNLKIGFEKNISTSSDAQRPTLIHRTSRSLSRPYNPYAN